ncbi:MAG: acyl carrier protein [Gammaproteobacteria bacterium]|nr:acyl carrier protein [Gammaproteobacteria bacterium]
MGLDAVELIIAVEDEFQIVISDEEAFKCETPQLLTDLVYSKLRQSESNVCPSMHGFYVVRKILQEQLNIPRENIKPETKLADLIDKADRTIVWQRLLSTIPTGKPINAPLEKPRWITLSIFISSLLVFMICLAITESLMLSFLTALFNSWVLGVATTLFKTEFPKNFLTVKDLIRLVSTLETKIWQRDQVYNRIKMLVVEQLGVKDEDIFA